MEIRKMCGCPVEIVCDHYVLPGVLKVPCPFCVEKDTALAQKTAECTTFFDDGVKVRSRIAELEEEARQVCGALGEFYGRGQGTAVEKIRFMREDHAITLQRAEKAEEEAKRLLDRLSQTVPRELYDKLRDDIIAAKEG